MGFRPLDTSESAWLKVREAHARLGPEGRVEAAFAASELIREATLAGLRLRHPGWDERQLRPALRFSKRVGPTSPIVMRSPKTPAPRAFDEQATFPMSMQRRLNTRCRLAFSTPWYGRSPGITPWRSARLVQLAWGS